MPDPQTARTVDPLGGKGTGAVHGYQIMAAPRRHPTQNLAALGALQYLLKRPPILHRRDRIQTDGAQGRVAGNPRKTTRPYRRRYLHRIPAPSIDDQTATSEPCFSKNIARPDIRHAPMENCRPETGSTTGSKTFRTTRSSPGLLMSLRNFNVSILRYLACPVNPILTYHPSSNDKPTLLLSRKPIHKVHIIIAEFRLYGKLLAITLLPRGPAS